MSYITNISELSDFTSNTLLNKQNILIPRSGVNITDDVISVETLAPLRSLTQFQK